MYIYLLYEGLWFGAVDVCFGKQGFGLGNSKVQAR